MNDKQTLIEAMKTLLSSYEDEIRGGTDETRLQRATGWVEFDFDAVTAYPWLEIGCWNPLTAARFVELGLSAGQVVRTVDKMVHDGERPFIASYGTDLLKAACNYDYAPSRIARFCRDEQVK